MADDNQHKIISVSRQLTYFGSIFLLLCIPLAEATEFQRVGRYLDRSVLVHDPGMLNPLLQVPDSIVFTDRMTVGDAIQTTLSGSGYRLSEPENKTVQALLSSRIPVAHLNFTHNRLDSVLAALVGVNRGFVIQIDHTSRRVRIVPQSPNSVWRTNGP